MPYVVRGMVPVHNPAVHYCRQNAHSYSMRIWQEANSDKTHIRTGRTFRYIRTHTVCIDRIRIWTICIFG